jgi:7-keto-8-aminopelargonate synthetase-like enzyme
MKDSLLNYEKIISAAALAKQYHVVFQGTDDVPYNGKTISLNGRELKNFGNCDYMGLQHDPRIKTAAMEALEKYGLMLCNSRAYTYNPLHDVLDEKLEKIMGYPTVATRCTSYGSLSAIPMLVGANDVIIADYNVHSSVQMAAALAMAQGTKMIKLEHNDMTQLEEKIIELQEKHDKIWYFFDSVYSMMGDHAPFDDINELLNRYEQFHAYCDDAWGISWTGQNGRGLALKEGVLHPKMIIVGSLTKGFGAGGGGYMTFHNEIHRNLIRDLGGLQIFSAPLTNPNLAAAIACADIHLNDEIYQLQDDFTSRLQTFRDTAISLGIPMSNDKLSPINYILIGNAEATMYITEKVKRAGFYINIAVYPLVSNRMSGMRILVTNYLSHEDIKQLLYVIAESMQEAFVKFDMPAQKQNIKQVLV